MVKFLSTRSPLVNVLDLEMTSAAILRLYSMCAFGKFCFGMDINV